MSFGFSIKLRIKYLLKNEKALDVVNVGKIILNIFR